MVRTPSMASLVVILFLGLAPGLFGQSIQVGGRVGLVISRLSGDGDYDTKLGPYGGIVAGIDLGPRVGLYPELGVVFKGARTKFLSTRVTPEGNLEQTTFSETVSLRYLELYVPAAFQVPLGPGSVSLRLYAGPAVALEVACSAEVEERVETFSPLGEQLDTTEGLLASGGCGGEAGSPPVPNFTATNGLDFGLAFGVGIDKTLGGGVFSGEVRYDLGLSDITERPDDSPRNRGFQFLVGYSWSVGRP